MYFQSCRNCVYDLTDARLAFRPQMEDEAQERIKKDIPDEKLSFWDFQISTSMTDEQNREDGMDRWFTEQKRMRRMEQIRRERDRRTHDRRERPKEHNRGR